MGARGISPHAPLHLSIEKEVLAKGFAKLNSEISQFKSYL